MRLHRSSAAKAITSAPRSPALAGLVCAAVAIALLPGCSWLPWRHDNQHEKVHACNKPQLYEQAKSVPVLTVPAGLDPLNTRGALKIPELNEAEVPRALSDPCLDEAPKYSNARLLPRPGSGDSQKKHWYSFGKKAKPPAQAPAAPAATVPAAPQAAAPAAAAPASPATP